LSERRERLWALNIHSICPGNVAFETTTNRVHWRQGWLTESGVQKKDKRVYNKKQKRLMSMEWETHKKNMGYIKSRESSRTGENTQRLRDVSAW